MGIKEIKEKFKEGTLIKIIRMVDDLPAKYHVPAGVIGKVTGVSEEGIVLMNWSNGSSVGLMVDEDEYEVLEAR